MSRLVRAVCAALLMCALAGCVRDQQYRIGQSVYFEKLNVADYDRTQTTDLEDPKGSYRLAFVEFNDRGQMFDPSQLERGIEHITRARAVRGAKPPVIAVFVHGWKNNASDGSGNVWGFRQVLAGLAFQYVDQEVIGIYVGWRGATVSAPVLKEFTVFDRHRASQRVPVPVMVGAIQRMMRAAKGPDVPGAPATIVLIGHSFGGGVLETSVTPVLSSAITNARAAGSRTVVWPADLIILLNEAEEAELSYPLMEQMDEEMEPRNPCVAPGQGEPMNQRPAVISISSTGDTATRTFFPGEQLLGRPFSRRKYMGPDRYHVGRARLYYSTTAHIGTLRSHALGRSDDPEVVRAGLTCQPSLITTLSLGATTDVEYTIVERSGAPNRTPYWAMHMPTSIVPDHSTIFTQAFRDFVISLIAQALEYPPQDRLRSQPLLPSR